MQSGLATGASAYLRRCFAKRSASIQAENLMWTKCSRALLLWLSVIAGSLAGENILESPETDVSKFFRHLDVIPDVISVGPQVFLNVTYLANIHADRGVQLQPQQVQDAPQVNFIAEKDDYYTLIMTDAHVPDESVLGLGDERVAYAGAMPATDTGMHRYVFLLYKQKSYLKFDIEQVPKHSTVGRGRFSTRNFVNKYDLGIPLADNYFTSQTGNGNPLSLL